MLLPCGISLFSGVEFVCCPKHYKGMQMIGPRVGKLLGYLFTEVVKNGKCVCVGERLVRLRVGCIFTFLINSFIFIIRKVLIGILNLE